MKKILYAALIAVVAAITITGGADAKRMKQRPTSVTNNNTTQQMPSKTIPVTKNTKNMLLNTQALKHATTPEEVVIATQKVEENISKDPFALLKLEEIALRKEITEQKEFISQQESYISYFDSDDVEIAKEDLITLEDELKNIQTKLGKITETQPAAVSRLKYYALGTLISTVGLAAVLHYFGYNVTGGISSTAKTILKHIPSPANTWETTKNAFRYGSTAVSIGLAILNAKSFAQMLAKEINDEESQTNPDQEKINQLYEQLEEQNNRIAELEAKAANTQQ